MIITPGDYLTIPNIVKRDHNRVMVGGLIPMEVKSVRRLETGEFWALVVIPALHDNRVREVALRADDELVIEQKKSPF